MNAQDAINAPIGDESRIENESLPGLIRIHDLPQSSLQALVADAARAVSMPLLLELESAGVFALSGPDDQANAEHLETLNFHRDQFSIIAALACVVQGVYELRKHPKDGHDGHDGQVPILPFHHQPFMTLDRSLLGRGDAERALKEFSAFISRRVHELSDRASGYKLVHDELEVNALVGRHSEKTFNFFRSVDDARTFSIRMRATLDVLLCASAALQDAELAATICQAMNRWCDRTLAASSEDDLIKPFGVFYDELASEHWRVSPAYLTLCFDAHDVLQVMTQMGLDAKLAVFKSDSRIPAESKEPVKGPVNYTLVDVLQRDKGIELSLPTQRLVLRLLKDSRGLYLNMPDLKESSIPKKVSQWGDALMKKEEIHMDAIEMALQEGAYHIDKSKSYNEAVFNGALSVVRVLGPDLDWSAYRPVSRPIDLALTGTRWADEPEHMKKVTLMVMQQAIDAGRGDLLAEPGLHMGQTHFVVSMPLHDCIDLGFKEGVVMCLEQGADPHFEGVNNLNAFRLAEQCSNPQISPLIRAVLAKSKAMGALAEIAMKSSGVH